MKAVARVARFAISGLFVPAGSALVLGLAALACGEADEVDGGLPMVTIAECEDMGGAPLFDPGDGRPVEMSCPDGLDAIAEFEEDFYGSEGGVCCTSDDAPADVPAADDAVAGEGDTARDVVDAPVE